MSRKKEKLEPIDGKKVQMYTCGPTVYNYAHIGNFRAYMFEDLLRRYIQFSGFEVEQVQNLTDVDDKTIRHSITEGKSLKEFTAKYIDAFFNDLNILNIEPAEHYPAATDYIPQMIEMIQELVDKGYAYQSEDGSVYYRIDKFERYGCLARLDREGMRSGSRVSQDEYEKDNVGDFALWKAHDEKDGDVFWESPWGRGRPGWHIECSAMSTKILGNHFDIHCGGVDNIFPHHENELAQSVGANGNNFVNYWVHSEHLMVDGEKMSKSKMNFFTLKDLKEKGFSPQSIRYQLLSGHYRTKITFSLAKKHESDKIINRITDFHLLLKKMGADEIPGNELPEAYEKFKECLNNDLDTSGAIAIFFGWMKSAKKNFYGKKNERYNVRAAWNFTCVFDSIFKFIKQDSFKIDSEIKALLKKRDEARKNKDWIQSDLIRDQILKHGWIVQDTKKGQEIKRK